MTFQGRLAVITGGSSGIGLHIASDLLGAGARVVVVSQNVERLQESLSRLTKAGTAVAGIACDVDDERSVRNMVDRVLAEHGCPDLLVNGAGFATYRTFETMSLDEITRLVSVNFLGAMRCTRLFLPQMIARRSGRIVNIASIAGRIVITPNAVYSASKHGMVAWSEALRYELADFGIQIHVICPGRVEQTAFFDHPTFTTRAQRPETRYTISASKVSRATLRAISRNRFLTYVPRALGALVWLTNCLGFVVKPAYGLILLSRIRSVHAREAAGLREEGDRPSRPT